MNPHLQELTEQLNKYIQLKKEKQTLTKGIAHAEDCKTRIKYKCELGYKMRIDLLYNLISEAVLTNNLNVKLLIAEVCNSRTNVQS